MLCYKLCSKAWVLKLQLFCICRVMPYVLCTDQPCVLAKQKVEPKWGKKNAKMLSDTVDVDQATIQSNLQNLGSQYWQ